MAQNLRPPCDWSRRRFLQQTSLGLGLACGSIPVFAQLTGENKAVSSQPRVGRGFIYGTHFYHPQSGPHPDQFREMIGAIANRYKFNINKVWSNWDYYNPKPGVFQFDDERTEKAAKANRLIQARWDLLKGYRPKAQVAILFGQDNSLLTFADAANEKLPTLLIGGYCKTFWNLDPRVDFVEPARIDRSRYEVLIVPWHLIGKKATCDAIGRFAEQGGTVVLEKEFGRFDEKYYFNPAIPPNGLDELFGYREMESLAINDGKLPIGALDPVPSGAHPYEAEIQFSQPSPIHVKAHTYLTPIEVRSATPIATCRQWTVAAT